jgi:phage shock protein A
MNLWISVGMLMGKVLGWLTGSDADSRSEFEKHVASLEEGRRGVKLQMARAIQQEQMLRARLAEFEFLAEQCARQAMEFLQSGREEAARTALRQKRTHLQNAAALRPELEEQHKTVRMLTESLEILESRLAEARCQLELTQGRQRRADTKLAVSGILEATNRTVERCESPVALPDGAVRRAALADATLDSERARLADALRLASFEEAVDAELVSLKEEIRRAG